MYGSTYIRQTWSKGDKNSVQTKILHRVCHDLEIWWRNLVQGHSISLTYRNLLVISKKSAMTLTFKQETWFKVTAHLHLQALFLWSISQIGQGKRKYGMQKNFSQLQNLVQDSIFIHFIWRHSVGHIGSRGEKICPEQVMSDGKTEF